MFGLGTIGRDMLYTIVSMYLLFFLTDILDLSNSTMWWMTGAGYVTMFVIVYLLWDLTYGANDIAIVLITWAFLMFTIFGVKEDNSINIKQKSTSLKEMIRILFQNDQLLFTAISMV